MMTPETYDTSLDHQDASPKNAKSPLDRQLSIHLGPLARLMSVSCKHNTWQPELITVEVSDALKLDHGILLHIHRHERR